jgi:hypothetical protein
MSDYDRICARREVVSDGLGRCHVTVPVGRVVVTAFASDSRYGSVEELHDGLSGDTAVRVEVGRLSVIRGIVLDRESATPIAGALLSNYVTNAGAPEKVTTDENGTFEFPYWVIGSAASLTIRAAGYGAEYLTVLIEPGKGWKVLSAAPDSAWNTDDPFIEVKLQREQRLFGRVVLPSGQPCSGVTVRAIGFAPSSFALRVRDSSDGTTALNGGFEIGGLRPDVTHMLLCEVKDEGVAIGVAESATGTLDVGALVLLPLGIVRGAVVLKDGTPVAGVAVEVTGSNYSYFTQGRTPELASAILSSIVTRGRVDSGGRFRVAGVPGQESLVRVIAGRSEIARAVVDLSPGSEIDVGTLVVEATLEQRRGTVVGADGVPLDDAKVMIISESGKVLAEAVTDAGGRFTYSCSADEGVSMRFVLLGDDGGVRCMWMCDSVHQDVYLRVNASG